MGSNDILDTARIFTDEVNIGGIQVSGKPMTIYGDILFANDFTGFQGAENMQMKVPVGKKIALQTAFTTRLTIESDGTITIPGTIDLGTNTIADGVMVGDWSFTAGNLVTTGTLGAGVATLATASTIGNLTLADGSITDSSGGIDFGDETLTTSTTITGEQITSTDAITATGDITSTSGQFIGDIGGTESAPSYTFEFLTNGGWYVFEGGWALSIAGTKEFNVKT